MPVVDQGTDLTIPVSNDIEPPAIELLTAVEIRVELCITLSSDIIRGVLSDDGVCNRPISIRAL